MRRGSPRVERDDPELRPGRRRNPATSRSSSASSGANDGSASAASASRPHLDPPAPSSGPFSPLRAARGATKNARRKPGSRAGARTQRRASKPIERLEPLDRSSSAFEAIAHACRVLEAKFRASGAASRGERARVGRVVPLEPVERASREPRTVPAPDRPERTRLRHHDPALAAEREVRVAIGSRASRVRGRRSSR